uniref:(northern house mosquito) hypothetical protein n=1 Tax=Culex pipiens TaxID=7175 RepID=A0A8D8G0E3_CULPI
MFIKSNLCLQTTAKPSVFECLDKLQSNLDKIDLTNFGDLAENIVKTLTALADHYQRCQDIPRDDPPTILQQMLISGCESSWNASVATELGRIGLEIQVRVHTAVDLVGQFSKCTGIKF